MKSHHIFILITMHSSKSISISQQCLTWLREYGRFEDPQMHMHIRSCRDRETPTSLKRPHAASEGLSINANQALIHWIYQFTHMPFNQSFNQSIYQGDCVGDSNPYSDLHKTYWDPTAGFLEIAHFRSDRLFHGVISKHSWNPQSTNYFG
jgi:hypothetical protein